MKTGGDFRGEWEGKVQAVAFDPPWGIIPGVTHDKPIPEADIKQICEWLSTLLVDTGAVLIRLSQDPFTAVKWMEGLKGAGLNMETDPIQVNVTQSFANS